MDKRTAEVIATITEERHLFPEASMFWEMRRAMRQMTRLVRGTPMETADVPRWYVRGYAQGWRDGSWHEITARQPDLKLA